MANSIHKNLHGPLWPLGQIAPTPGTPLSMMSNVDPSSVNAPETLVGTGPGAVAGQEFTVRAQQIIVQGFKGSAPMTANAGNIYVVMRGVQGAGNRTDQGSIVLIVPSGATGVIASAPLNRNVFSPYELFIDCDNSGDAALVTLVIQ